MSWTERLRVAAWLGRMAGQVSGPEPESRRIGPVTCDWYEPSGPRRATVVALHGVTLNGRLDHRLRRFARALARSGVGCVVPGLPGLGAGRWDAGDVEAAGQAIRAAADGAGAPAVVVGFSHGASIALVAAAQPAWAGAVSDAVAFGAYHSLGRVLSRLAALPAPVRPGDWDDYVYAHLVELHRSGEALGLDPRLRADAADLLRRYCESGFGAEKRRFYEERLRPLDLARRAVLPRPATLAALSPEGQLEGLRCRVALVHDPHDHLVPASEAEAIHAELGRRPAARGQDRLLLTRLVRHVAPSGALHPGEALRLLDLLAPLLGGGRR